MPVTAFTPALGPMTPRLLFATREEARCAVRAVIGRARHRITILSPDLEPDLYGHPSVLQALTRFVLEPGYREVRLLCTGAAPTDQTHALLVLARRLSTSVDLRFLERTLTTQAVAYVVADREATVLRLDAGQWHGMYALENPAAARTHLSHFECLWQTCPATDAVLAV